MEGASLWHWIVLLVVAFLWIFPLWKILERTGRPGAIALLAIFPLLGVVLLWWIALGPWPSREGNTTRPGAAPRP